MKLKVYPGLVPMYNDTMYVKSKVPKEELETWKNFQRLKDNHSGKLDKNYPWRCGSFVHGVEYLFGFMFEIIEHGIEVILPLT